MHAVRRGTRDFDLEKLVDDVMQAWDEYPSDKIDAMWRVKARNMLQIIEAEGGNDYDQHRSKEEKEEQKQEAERAAKKGKSK